MRILRFFAVFAAQNDVLSSPCYLLPATRYLRGSKLPHSDSGGKPPHSNLIVPASRRPPR